MAGRSSATTSACRSRTTLATRFRGFAHPLFPIRFERRERTVEPRFQLRLEFGGEGLNRGAALEAVNANLDRLHFRGATGREFEIFLVMLQGGFLLLFLV